MAKQNKEFKTANNSNSLEKQVFTPKMYAKVKENGGSVTYFVTRERYSIREDKTYKKEIVVLKAPLSKDLLVTPNGRFYPLTDVLRVLKTTCESLGADYFVVQ